MNSRNNVNGRRRYLLGQKQAEEYSRELELDGFRPTTNVSRDPVTGRFCEASRDGVDTDDELVEFTPIYDLDVYDEWRDEVETDSDCADDEGEIDELGGYDEDYDMSWYDPEGENDYAVVLMREFAPADEDAEYDNSCGYGPDEDGEMTRRQPKAWKRWAVYTDKHAGRKAVRKSWARHASRLPVIGFTEADLRTEEVIKVAVEVIETIADIARDLLAA